MALAVWGPRARNPWLGLVLDAVSEQLGMPFPPPGVPGPFALEDAERLAALLAGAGLAEVAVTELAVPVRTALRRGVVDADARARRAAVAGRRVAGARRGAGAARARPRGGRAVRERRRRSRSRA